MTLRGGAVLAFWHDLAPGGEPEFVQWHNLEHIPERVGIEGFLRGRRYEAAGDVPRYFVLYETENLGVLDGAVIVRRVPETPEDAARAAAVPELEANGVPHDPHAGRRRRRRARHARLRPGPGT